MNHPSAPAPRNRLARETSAYLRQHAANPVDWLPWGEEAFARARDEDRPLLVSIGYSACHWCHVMERESFEDPDIAAWMNEHFVNVKVDREERPDVDRIYMDYVLRALGHGGWPLTVFCTPEGRPFHGGTYFPPQPRHGMPSFRQVLEAVAEAWRTRREEIERGAANVVRALATPPRGAASGPPGAERLAAAARALLAVADRTHGGFGSAPKFPTPTHLEALLAASDVLPEAEARDALAHVRLTAVEMSRRGLYDQIGFGFHRYCVDADWTVPHFEKMLYDQGQLLSVYAELARRAGAPDPDLVWPIRETLEWLRREMAAPDGGFFASLDADSEGEEGRYYVWTPAEIEAVLGPERGAAFCRAYGVTPEGNFEGGRSVLVDVAREPREVFRAERRALLHARARRTPPATDPKRVASWNAWLASGLARAAAVLDDADLLHEAAAVAAFVAERMTAASGRLTHVYDEGACRTPGFLEDAAALLTAALDLFRAGADERWWQLARATAQHLVTVFWDEDAGDFFLTPEDAGPLPHRPRPDADGATPHATGEAALGLLRAATLAGREDWRRIAERVLHTHAFVLERAPQAYTTLARAAALAERGLAVAVVAGDPDAPPTRALARAARRQLVPEDAVLVIAPGAPAPEGIDPAWLAGRTPEAGRATAWLCRGTACSLPVHDPEALRALDAPGPAS